VFWILATLGGMILVWIVAPLTIYIVLPFVAVFIELVFICGVIRWMFK